MYQAASASLYTVSILLTRYWMEYRQIWRALLARDILDRLLFLFAFGYGFGAMVQEIDGINYLAFVATGILCSSPMMTMTMAGTFKVYENINGNRVWQSWLATPMNLKEIMLGELLYANFRSMPSVFILFVLAYFMGGLPNPISIIYVLPILMLANLAYGAIAMCFSAHITRVLYFAFVNTLWMTPMYLFSGVFFDISQTPHWMQIMANIFPLHHVINIVRPLMLGQPLDTTEALFSITTLLILFIAAFTYAYRVFKVRLES